MLIDALPAASHVARAARALSHHDEGWVLGYHPVARMNPFQSLIYSRAESSGFAPVGLIKRIDFPALEVAIRLGVNAALHIHWTSEVTAGAESPDQAEAGMERYIEELTSLKDLGVRLVWSVHNVLPHRCEFPQIESRLRSRLAELVDVVHVMADGTEEIVAPHYRIPGEKVVKVPHPSYVGAYPSFKQPGSARFELGYDPPDMVLGAVGSIQPYKGLLEFAEATRQQRETDSSLRALIAGIPGRDEASKALVIDLQKFGHVDLIARRLTDAEVATAISALDFTVLPYRASLNSGAALLSLSFGTPIVAPRIGGFAPLIDKGFGVGYESGDPEGLLAALGDLREFRESFDSQGAHEFASSLAGPKVSKIFFDELRTKLSERA